MNIQLFHRLEDDSNVSQLGVVDAHRVGVGAALWNLLHYTEASWSDCQVGKPWHNCMGMPPSKHPSVWRGPQYKFIGRISKKERMDDRFFLDGHEFRLFAIEFSSNNNCTYLSLLFE